MLHCYQNTNTGCLGIISEWIGLDLIHEREIEQVEEQASSIRFSLRNSERREEEKQSVTDWLDILLWYWLTDCSGNGTDSQRQKKPGWPSPDRNHSVIHSLSLQIDGLHAIRLDLKWNELLKKFYLQTCHFTGLPSAVLQNHMKLFVVCVWRGKCD